MRNCVERRSAEVLVRLKCIACDWVALRDVGQTLKCENCGKQFGILNQVPRFVDRDLYAGSFGFQWNRFARTQLDSANGTTRSRDTFIQRTGWGLKDLKGRRVLDAGCGMGRFAEICADAGAEVHAVDLSSAVDAAYQNLGHRTNVYFYQGDIMNLPFPDESFDFVYSIGVLHHTPNTKAAFLRLSALLKPGGTIAIWVYSKKLRFLLGSEILRKITPSLPKSWLLKASKIAIPLYYIHRIPLIGTLPIRGRRRPSVTQIVLPTSMEPDPEWRWLDTFDWYSPRYQWKYSYEEVEAWFAEAGLTGIQRGKIPVSVHGIRSKESRPPQQREPQVSRPVEEDSPQRASSKVT